MPQHIYQRTINGYNIFYDIYDYIVFYSVFSSTVKKYNIRVLGLCIMPDHIHTILESENMKTLSDFICHYTSVFVKEFNRSTGRNGQLFKKAFGSAPKNGDKKIRTSIAYVMNNPVEKKLCAKAEEYRWNFLAYAKSKHPFLEQATRSHPSSNLVKAIKNIDFTLKNGWYINYKNIEFLFRKLSENEKEYLIDHIINSFSPFDYNSIISYYKDYESMLLAINSMTGSEYDIKETFYPHSDIAYGEISEYLRKEVGLKHARDVISMNTEEKISLANEISHRIHISPLQIRKYFHM